MGEPHTTDTDAGVEADAVSDGGACPGAGAGAVVGVGIVVVVGGAVAVSGDGKGSLLAEALVVVVVMAGSVIETQSNRHSPRCSCQSSQSTTKSGTDGEKKKKSR